MQVHQVDLHPLETRITTTTTSTHAHGQAKSSDEDCQFVSHTPIGYMGRHTSRHSIPRHWYAWEDILPGAWWSQLEGGRQRGAEGLEIRRESVLYRYAPTTATPIAIVPLLTSRWLHSTRLDLTRLHSQHPVQRRRRYRIAADQAILSPHYVGLQNVHRSTLLYCWPIIRNPPSRTCSPRIGAHISLCTASRKFPMSLSHQWVVLVLFSLMPWTEWMPWTERCPERREESVGW